MSKQGALEELIKSMFNDEELRAFFRRMPETEPLLAGLPGDSASLLRVVFEAIGILERHGIIGSKFFAALEEARPLQRERIHEVAAIWGLALQTAIQSTSASITTPFDTATTSSNSPFMIAGSTPPPADVAILIALKDEWEVFWPIAGEPAGVKDASGGYLYSFEVPSAGRAYRCVALFMGEMGPGQATNATHRLLAAKPKTLVNLGIAAAIHDDLKLCDVVVADQVDDYLATVKVVEKGKDGWAFELRGSVYKTTYGLVQDVINLKFAYRDAFASWRSMCAPAMAERVGQIGKALAAKQIREAPTVEKVHLASGPTLAAAEAFSKWIQTTRDGLLKALEMEAAGMMLAAHQLADPTRTLVLRGISDFGDKRKARTDRQSHGAFRFLAMYNATQLLWTMLRLGLLPRHDGLGHPQPSTVDVHQRDVILCAWCGALPSDRRECSSLEREHNFCRFHGLVYCDQCGALPEQPQRCLPPNVNHHFTAASSPVRCQRCGVTPGGPDRCTGLDPTHHFLTDVSAVREGLGER